MIRLGIIGNSGREKDSPLTPGHFEKSKEKVLRFIKKTLKTPGKNIIFVSGGSSWMDHLVVSLFEECDFSGITLYLPASFDFKGKKFVETTEGKRLNFLHQQFSKKNGLDVRS